MANNCLKTQLKTSVQNENLSYFGCVKIKANPGTYNTETLPLIFNSASSVKGLNGANIYINGVNVGDTVDYIANETRTITPQNEGGTYLILNKYKLIFFGSNQGAGLLEYSLDDFSGCVSLNTFTSMNDIIHGDLSGLKNTVITTFTMRKATYVTGSFSSLPATITTLDLQSIDKDFKTSELSHLVNVTMINLSNNDGSLSSGNITDLGTMKQITRMAIGSSSVRGNIEDFVAIQRTGYNARTTCDRIDMPWAGGIGRGLKFKGNEIVSKANTYIHWDATTLYLNQDGTDVDSVDF